MQNRAGTVKSAEPKQMNIFVRKPAGLCFNCRSRPIIPPRIAATVRRSMVVESTTPISVRNVFIVGCMLVCGYEVSEFYHRKNRHQRGLASDR